MKLIAISVLSVLLVTLAFAGPATQPAEPVNKFCAVMQEDHKVDPKVTYEYKGQTIGFCCPDCIPDFKKDPEKYVKTMK